MVLEYTDRSGRHTMDPGSVLLKKRMVFLTGKITDETAEAVIQQMLCLTEAQEDITLVINSPGGSITAGMAIYDTMQGLPCDVATVGIGMADSMGAFLLAAGTPGKRRATPNCEIMIHQASGCTEGLRRDMQVALGQLEKMDRNLDILLSGFTGQAVERIRRDTERDYFLTACEALDYGLIDTVCKGVI